MRNGCVLVGKTLQIDAGGKRWFFETPPYCGLAVTDKRGKVLKDPPKHSPFWEAARLEQMKAFQQKQEQEQARIRMACKHRGKIRRGDGFYCPRCNQNLVSES